MGIGTTAIQHCGKGERSGSTLNTRKSEKLNQGAGSEDGKLLSRTITGKGGILGKLTL